MQAMRFLFQVITGRWFMAFASLLIMSMAGATYMFGLYSNDIKTSLGYDQTTLNLLSFFKDVGGNVGIVAGLVLEVTPPWVVLTIGAVMNFFGYFMMWLSVTNRINKPKIWQMCLYIYSAANSQAFANTGALVIAVKNFPESSGLVLGLLKGFLGLSGAILTQFYHALYGDNYKALILLIGWLPAAVSLVFLRTIRLLKVIRHPNDAKFFYNLLYISLSLAGVLMVLIILQNRIEFVRIEYIGSAIIVLVLLFLPLVIVYKEEYQTWKNKLIAKSNSNASQVVVVVTEIPPLELTTTASETKEDQPPTTEPEQRIPDSCFQNIFNPPKRGQDYTILQALFSIDMWILFVAITCGIGGTLTGIDNLGQIGGSLGYKPHSITTFVSLVSIWNYLGRAVAGFASEFLLTNYKIPRTLLLTLTLLISLFGHLLIAFAIPNSVYFASVIIGFCFGAQWPLTFAIIGDIFGLKYYSTLINFGTVASPVGSYILNVRVAGRLYDQEALKQMEALGHIRVAGEDLNCIGVECYRMAFIIIAAATMFGCLVSCILVYRTRNFYKSDIYKKFRVQGH